VAGSGEGEAMSILVDFVVARREQFAQVARSDDPYKDFGGVDAKWMAPSTLVTLYAVLSGEPRDDSLMAGARLFEDPGLRWVYEVPAKLVRRLAAMGPKQFDDVASVLHARWDFDFWTLAELRQLLAEIAALCRAAVATDQFLLMWMSL
jgi:hypothetical protein